MKIHYFEQQQSDKDDILSQMAIHQGYVPETCLLGGNIIMAEVQSGKDPCAGCQCDRSKCHGRALQEEP